MKNKLSILFTACTLLISCALTLNAAALNTDSQEPEKVKEAFTKLKDYELFSTKQLEKKELMETERKDLEEIQKASKDAIETGLKNLPSSTTSDQIKKIDIQDDLQNPQKHLLKGLTMYQIKMLDGGKNEFLQDIKVQAKIISESTTN